MGMSIRPLTELERILWYGHRPMVLVRCPCCGHSRQVSSTTVPAALERMGWRGMYVTVGFALASGYVWVCGECVAEVEE